MTLTPMQNVFLCWNKFSVLFVLPWLDLLLYFLIFPVSEATATALTELISALAILKHNRSLQPISQVYDLASHSTYVVCVNFIHEFKVDSERQIFEKLFMAILIILRVFASNLLKGRCRRYIFIFSFWCLTFGLNSVLKPNKPTH